MPAPVFDTAIGIGLMTLKIYHLLNVCIKYIYGRIVKAFCAFTYLIRPFSGNNYLNDIAPTTVGVVK